jgi:hypothetical protein
MRMALVFRLRYALGCAARSVFRLRLWRSVFLLRCALGCLRLSCAARSVFQLRCALGIAVA